MNPTTLYLTPRGDFAPAGSLTPEEAVAVRDQLLAEDLPRLRAAALDAVLASTPTGFAISPRAAGPGIRGVAGPAFTLRQVA
jgi:hypothetical protein